MRGKHKNSRGRPNRNTGAVRKTDKFSKNNKFIQRSRQMEKSYRTENQFHSTIANNEFNMAVDMLPSLKEDTNMCYEQLVDQFSSANTAPAIEQNNCIPAKHSSVSEKEQEQDQFYTNNLKPHNSFAKRFGVDLTTDDITDLIAGERRAYTFKWSAIGNFKIEIPILKSSISVDANYSRPPEALKPADLQVLEVKSPICTNAAYPLSPLQMEIFHCANNYLDIYFPRRSHENAEAIRYAYCLHAVNHMVKSRAQILRNNERIAGLVKDPKLLPSEISIPDSFRDQGLTRMKVLIILPFRESALKTVQVMGNLLFAHLDKKSGLPIARYERFLKDFSGDTIYFPKTNPKPIDYEQTFKGNTDDNFKIGIRFTKKTMSLYSDISSSDILMASPLALRMIINDKEQDFDFLNSIELLIIDQAELFMAQNWENLLNVLDHLHLQPQKLPDTNCQRVRSYCLNGTSRFYRQTLLFSSHELPEFRGLLNNKCHNYQGRVRITNKIEYGDISNVLTPVKQVFQRIDCLSVESAFEDRFQYFIRNILPQLSRSGQTHCLLYVPSYFDYVRLRNHFKKEMVNYVQISEYTKKEKVSRARDIFFHSGAQFLLYSERAHFFRRTRIKGVRHLIFYQPPNFPHFYSELINLMLETNQNPRDGLKDSMNVKVLYTKYDVLSLSNIVGNENAIKLTAGTSDSYSFSNNN